MKLVRFRDPAGTVRTGKIDSGTVKAGGLTFSKDEIDFLPPAEPTKIVGVGVNYIDHYEESTQKKMGGDLPHRPYLFWKTPNTLAGHEDVIPLPKGKHCSYEAELAVVIGEQCRNVSADEALDYVEGYTCGNDISNRDDQMMEKENRWNYVRGKSFDNAGPMGPVLATPDEVPDDATIEFRLNGETRQKSSIDQLNFGVRELIEEITQTITLEPGDAIFTGTPSLRRNEIGDPSLSDGDKMEVEIDGIGVLENTARYPE